MQARQKVSFQLRMEGMRYETEDVNLRSRMDDVARAIQVSARCEMIVEDLQLPCHLTKANWVQCHPETL